MQVKYKQDAAAQASVSLYHRLPETTETQLAKELRDIYSEVRNAASASQPSVGVAGEETLGSVLCVVLR